MKKTQCVALLVVMCLCLAVFSVSRVCATTIVGAYCSTTYKETNTCPAKTCLLTCQKNEGEMKCKPACLPSNCEDIDAAQCPEEFCLLMTDCSGGKICHDPMTRETPSCGDLSYEGQDVECCQGLVKRCGIEFFEGICDMKGENSVYNLPICIPCGNGICGQFENRCNCPEDCGEFLGSQIKSKK